jgi:uncharacterized protein (DUF433 family)
VAKEYIRDYIEERNGGLYVKDTRVSLASVIHKFREGATPETILDCFPSLASLENIYGAITFILANPKVIDDYMEDEKRAWEEFARTADPPPQSFIDRVKRLREEHKLPVEQNPFSSR